MKKLRIGISILLTLVFGTSFTLSAAKDRSLPVVPEEANLLLERARSAYTLEMDATLDTNHYRSSELSAQLADYYSNMPETSLIENSTLPASRTMTDQEASDQHVKIEAILKQKGIDPQKYTAFQKAQQEAEEFRKLSALERKQINLQTGIQSFVEGDTVVQDWTLEDFKLVSAEKKDAIVTIVADMHVRAHFAYSAPDGKVIEHKPRNGLRYSFYFHKEGPTWKIIDWKFEFLPNEGP